MPPPVLIGESSLIRALATDVPEAAKQLVDKHWPGPLTVICKIQPSLRMDLGDTEGTIALRVPDHDLARAVLRRTGPMAVSSANISGQPAALPAMRRSSSWATRSRSISMAGSSAGVTAAVHDRRLQPVRRGRGAAPRSPRHRGAARDAARPQGCDRGTASEPTEPEQVEEESTRPSRHEGETGLSSSTGEGAPSGRSEPPALRQAQGTRRSRGLRLGEGQPRSRAEPSTASDSTAPRQAEPPRPTRHEVEG